MKILNFFLFVAALLAISQSTVAGQSKLPLFALEGDIMMPFPRAPELVGRIPQDESETLYYSWGEEGYPLAYSAVATRGAGFGGSADTDHILKAMTRNTIEGMRLQGAEIEVTREEAVFISSMPGRVFVATIETDLGSFRSHTLTIAKGTAVFQWAIQDSPAVSGNLAEEIFFREIHRIHPITKQEPASARPTGLQVVSIEPGIEIPLTGTPDKSIESTPFGEVTLWLSPPSQYGFSPSFSKISGLPNVADPPATILRGMAGEGVELSSGSKQLLGRTARYSVYEIQLGTSMIRFFSIAFAEDADVYVWSVSTDRTRYFQELEAIGKREAKRIVLRH